MDSPSSSSLYCCFGGCKDCFKWLLTKNGFFTVRSMYLDAIDTHLPFQHKKIWKWKLPLKIKDSLWFLQKGVVLTKDNLAKKNRKWSQKCVCCDMNETIQHHFIDCPLAKMIWKFIFYATNLNQPRSINICLLIGLIIIIRMLSN
jgi:hypothetical protein